VDLDELGAVNKPTTKYPNTTTGIITCMIRDIKTQYKDFFKDKKVKQIKIVKVDKKKHTLHLWVHKENRTNIAKIMSLLDRYPFTFMNTFDSPLPPYKLECTVEINPKTIPKGISILD
jgi:hypothetical protein